jgi:hypothetical protein
MTREETPGPVHVQMQENASYQPSTNFEFVANPAYGTDIAIAPEIPTEDNIAYQRTCSSQLSGSNPDNISQSSGLQLAIPSPPRNDSLVSDES